MSFRLRDLRHTLRVASSQASDNRRALRLVWQAAPRWTVYWVALLVLQGTLPVAAVYCTKLVIDALTAARESGGAGEQVEKVVVLLAATAAIFLLIEVMQSAAESVRTAHSEVVQDYIKGLVHEQAVRVDYEFYESPEYLDLLEQIRSESGGRPVQLLESLGNVLQSGITLVAMAAVLMSYGVWLPPVLLLSTLPAFWVVLRFDRAYHRWWKSVTQDRRWAQYYDVVLTHSDSAAEVRLFDLGKYFQSSYQQLRRRMRGERLRQMRRHALSKTGAGAGALLVSGGALGWMAWRVAHGAATLGDIALFYQAFSRGQGLMRSLLGGVNRVLSNSLYLTNLFAFLDLKPRITASPHAPSPPARIEKGIRFRRVAFSYPGSTRQALREFDLDVPAGKIVAVVGANGAGKSTLLKLLCRFYDPTDGRIEIDGVDIKQFAPHKLRRLITVLFQAPVPYHATASQNIRFGDLSSDPDAAEIERASRSAGAHQVLADLPDGYDTVLGKWFVNGAELSGGEWQRVALARAYFRQSPIILLDEPTSSMDSWTEIDWFERFRALAGGRTAILITHHFTVARQADVIHVMDKGRIVEAGSHDELLARGGLYAQSWSAQTRAKPGRATRECDVPENDAADELLLEKV